MTLGLPVVGHGLAKVIRSEDPEVKVGEFMTGIVPWQLYTVFPWEGRRPSKPGRWPSYTVDLDAMPGLGLFKIQKLPNAPWTTVPGVLGGVAQTAWMGLKEFSNMKAGETIYVSTAAGAVGLIVCQIAKIYGLKVIGSTGSDHKVKFLLEEVGIDHAFNYKTFSPSDALSKWGPIDIYWDNVGGSTLEAAIDHCNVRARIISCGYITEYNGEDKYGVKNLAWVFKKRITIYGLLMRDLMQKWMGPFMAEMRKFYSENKIKTQEHIVHGLENTGQAWVDMLQGRTTGKTVVVVSDPDE